MIEAISAMFEKTRKPILVYSAEYEHVRLLSLKGIPAFNDWCNGSRVGQASRACGARPSSFDPVGLNQFVEGPT